MESDLQQMVADPVALAVMAALLLAAACGTALPGATPPLPPPPDTTTREDLWLARHRVANARALLWDPRTEGSGPDGAAEEEEEDSRRPEAPPASAMPTVEAHLLEALRQIRDARAKPGWRDLPPDRTAALDRVLPDVEQAVAILRHHRDTDTRRRLGMVLDTLHGALEGTGAAE